MSVPVVFRSCLQIVLSVIIICVIVCGNPVSGIDNFEESLWIKGLPSGHIHSHMEFLIKDDKSSNRNHTRLFPRALSEILMAHDVQEMHFSLTQGYWRLESWGEPVSAAAPTGALMSAWFYSQDSETADNNWKGFTSRLSGLSCASLNFLDEKTSIEPKFSYRPQGTIRSTKTKNLHVRVGALPKEHICTENLTPWTKLLPCGISRGIASLLRSKQVFNTHYHSAAIHFTQTENEINLKLSLSLVFDRPANVKPTENFARRILGSLAIFPCHPTGKTTVQIWKNGLWNHIEHTEINSLKVADIPETKPESKRLIFTPVKYMGGYGQEYGEMIVEMTNHLNDSFLPVLYVEVLPWYIRPYLHTMKIEVVHATSKLSIQPGNLFHYTPGRDRKALHKLEMDISIPPSSTVTLSYTVEKGHLKWDEYPPDANHGFYLEAAHFEVNYTDSYSAQQETKHYYSRILLINLSTPDFSMPYNVICLTCTVVALAFGPIHNITTKRLQLKIITPRREFLKQWWKWIRGGKEEESEESNKTTLVEDEIENKKNNQSEGSVKLEVNVNKISGE